jgi:hypothetical protein
MCPRRKVFNAPPLPPLQGFSGTTSYGTSRLEIPSTYTEAGVYRVVLSVQNFLGSGTDSSPLFIVASADAVPSVAVDGQSSRTVTRSSALMLFARVRRACAAREGVGRGGIWCSVPKVREAATPD